MVLRRDGLLRTLRRLLAFTSPVLPGLIAYLRDSSSHQASQALVPKYALHAELGMTSPNEQAYFEHYAHRIYKGDGEVVDLGCWLGSTTFALARGLRAAGRPGPVHAYDRFIWEEWMEGTTPASMIDPLDRGQSFVDQFRALARPWGELVSVHEANLTTERWDGGPIEFLLVDAMKDWTLTRSIARNFFPHVIPGGHILQQDFSHRDTPWVHLLNYRLSDYLEPVYDVPASASYVFRVVRPIPPDLDLAFSEGDVEPAFRLSLRITRSDKAPEIRAAEAKARESLARSQST